VSAPAIDVEGMSLEDLRELFDAVGDVFARRTDDDLAPSLGDLNANIVDLNCMGNTLALTQAVASFLEGTLSEPFWELDLAIGNVEPGAAAMSYWMLLMGFAIFGVLGVAKAADLGDFGRLVLLFLLISMCFAGCAIETYYFERPYESTPSHSVTQPAPTLPPQGDRQ
jgi:hypothetical protein